MSRSHPPLQQHLLTRSDLARLGVPAGDILAWLARGAIEQVGTLTGDDGDDPVFTAAPELRAELAIRLASIGKSSVVLSPLRVRSFLLRALMHRHAEQSTPEGVAGTMTPAETLAEHLATTDLAQVLHEAATELEADVEHVLRIAEEEARLEAAIGATAAKPAPPFVEAGAEPNVDAAGEDDGEEACFDVDDLASALGEWDDEPAHAQSDPEPQSAATGRSIEPEGEAPPSNAPEVADLPERTEATLATAVVVETAIEPADPAPSLGEPDAAATTLPEHEQAESAMALAQTPTEAPLAAEAPTPGCDTATGADSPIEAAAVGALPTVELAPDAPTASVGAADEPCADGDEPCADGTAGAGNESEAAAAPPAAPTSEEPTMSAEPMATQHDEHSTEEQAASDAIASAEQALEPLLHDDDQPPALDPKEIAAALSILDLDDAPKHVEQKAAHVAPAAAPPSALQASSDAQTNGEVDANTDANTDAETEAETEAGDGASQGPISHGIDAEQAATAAPTRLEAAAANPAAPTSTLTVDAPPTATDEVRPTTAATPAAEVAHAESGPLLAASMQRVETFLGELKAALVEMAGRPVATPSPVSQVSPTPAVDLAPLVGAIEGGLQKSADSSAATATALTSLAEKLDGIGQRIERSAIATESMAQHAHAPKSTPEPARFLVARSSPVPMTLLAVAALVTAWSVLFWFKTGSPRLALGTLIGANLVGCVLLAPGRLR